MDLPMTLIREKYLKRGRIMDLPMTLMTGGIHEVEGKENSLKIDGIARFAVEEHNKKENAMVQFVKVVNAKEQVVAGMMYYITIEATDGGVKKLYEAKVWLMEWMNFKEVQGFKLVRDAPGEAEVWMREWMNFKEEWLNLKEVTEFKPVGDTAPGEASA